ncbi:MAG TPA: PH domain-containing protein, partial [Gemmatimonadaceae bacterium]|nr:PH domain-containing protein [Gemmatimonadaceae bacterium]
HHADAPGGCVMVASTLLLLADARLLLLVIPLLLFAIAKAATLYVTMRLDYEMRWYVITDRSLMIREGVWNTKEVTLTFANAQNVRVTQGPLERFFGFSNVEIEVAGGGAGEGGVSRNRASLRGLAEPQAVRDLILDRLKRHRTAGLGDPDDVHGRVLPDHVVAATPRRAHDVDVAPPDGANAVMRDAWNEARALRVALERRMRSMPE